MRQFLLIKLLLLGLFAFGQKQNVDRTIYARDISDITKRLFYAQLDSFQKGQNGTMNLGQREDYLFDSSLLPYRKHKSSLVYGIKNYFGRTGGIGCGYHEGDEPHKITNVRNGKQIEIPLIYDFDDSTKWLSSSNFNQEKINLYFKKGFPPLTTLIFFAGDQSSIENWNKFSRPRTIIVYVNNKYWATLNLEDCICEQAFNIETIESANRNLVISLVIKSAYEGKDNRVAISEINFDGVIH